MMRARSVRRAFRPIAVSGVVGLLALGAVRAQVPSPAAPPAPATAATAASLIVGHTERALQPGEAVVLTIRASEPLAGATASGMGTSWQAFPGPEPSTWLALAGIDIDAKPGPAAIAVQARTASGATLAASVTLTVKPKVFPTRRLTVDPKFVTPPKSAMPRIQRDGELLAKAMAVRSPARLWGAGFARPVPGAVISRFGVRSIFNGESRGSHRGTDFAGTTGTPVTAPAGGRVVLVDDLYFSGNTVVLNHGLGVFSLLCHLSKTAVKVGDVVTAGQVVGEVGATGRVTGPHLHWTARIGPAAVDPESLLAAVFPE